MCQDTGKAAEYNINTQKSIALLYTTSKQFVFEILEKCHLQSTKILKYKPNKISTYFKHLSTKVWWEKNQGLNKWGDILSSCIGRLNNKSPTSFIDLM